MSRAAHDEWVRVPNGTKMPKGTRYRSEDKVAGIHGWSPHDTQAIFVKRSDLDAILKPTPTPAEKLAEALSATSGSAYDTWTPADVLAALDAAGLTLAERADAVDVDPTTLAATPPAPQPPPDRSWVTTELIKADPRPWLIRWADDDDQDES